MIPHNKNVVVSFPIDCVYCKPLSTTEWYMQPWLKGGPEQYRFPRRDDGYVNHCHIYSSSEHNIGIYDGHGLDVINIYDCDNGTTVQ